MLQVQFELLSVFLAASHGLFESSLFLDKLHVVLQLRPRRNLNSCKVSLNTADSFFEADFTLIYIDFLPRFVTCFTTVPKSAHDILGVLEENLSENLVEIVRF